MARAPTPSLTAEQLTALIQVREGRDGWLFLVGGPNRPLDDYQVSPRRWWRLWRWAALVRARERRARALGARYLHVVVPEKLSVYPELIPELGIPPRRGSARALARLLGGRSGLVDVASALEAGKASGDMYLRTDTHWTLDGCHAAYRAIAAAAAVAAPLDLATRPHADYDLPGDLGLKFDPPRREPVRRYDLLQDAVRAYASPLVEAFEASGRPFALHRGAHVIYRNESPAADPRRVVLFGDSCAHFEPFLLTGMLAETFRALHFVWSAAIDWGHVERVRPDLVIGQIAERFMARVPNDNYDLEAFAARQLAAFSAAAG